MEEVMLCSGANDADAEESVLAEASDEAEDSSDGARVDEVALAIEDASELLDVATNSDEDVEAEDTLVDGVGTSELSKNRGREAGVSVSACSAARRARGAKGNAR